MTAVLPRTRSTRAVLALVCAAQFMVILDASIVNVALPAVDLELGFGSGLAWVVNGYLLTFAGFMLLGGRATDVFGHRRMLTGGLLLFTAASLAAGLAQAPGVLVGARVAQGVGAALLAPATLAVINTTFTAPGERARAFGAWSASGGVGGMAGAIAGGALTSGLSWRWVFLINVPIGAALITLALVALTPVAAGRRGSLDVTGAVTGTAGLAALIYGVMGGGERGWTSPWVLGPIAAGLVLLVAFVVTQARVARPMMPLRLFAVRGVAVGNAMLLLFGGVTIGMWYFSSMLLQNVLGDSALEAGLGQTPAAVMFVLVARVAAGLLPRLGVRALVTAGAVAFVIGFGWLSRADAGSAYLTGVLGPTLIIAVGIGLTFPTLMAAATADAPDGDAGTVGGLANTAGQVGSSLGLAALTAVGAYEHVFLAAAGLAVIIALLATLLRSRV